MDRLKGRVSERDTRATKRVVDIDAILPPVSRQFLVDLRGRET